jgi:hypothetical protein
MTTEKREPVKYTVIERSLVGNRIYEAGETAEYDGLPAENLAPQCEVGAARYQEYLESNRERVAKMIEQNAESGVGDVSKFAAQFTAALQAANEQHAAQMAALQESMASAIVEGIAAALTAQAKTAWTPPAGKGGKKATEDTSIA